jgi:hypothetical protein
MNNLYSQNHILETDFYDYLKKWVACIYYLKSGWPVFIGLYLFNILDSNKIAMTMVNCRLFDAASMNELNGKQMKRQPFLF